MSTRLSPVRIADDIFEIRAETPRHAQALASALRGEDMVEDVVAGLSSVCIKFAPKHQAEVANWLGALALSPRDDETAAAPVTIEIRYGGADGPDFAMICEALSLSPEALIAMHSGLNHTVEMIGFTPGFAYISGLPEQAKVPRLSNPRSRVPAGSVGISAAFTGIYSLAGPGGWPLIGRTSQPLFDSDAEAPFLLQPGQRLKFKAV